jgi:hypothetical protein
MHKDYWQRQTAEAPLFPDILWSQPENKLLAGKLLIVGGNAHGFAAVAEAYAEAERAGAGTIRIILPDGLRKTVGRVLEAGEYVPSTPSGGFAQQALAELLDMAAWADGVLIAGDLGRNSETAVLIEQFLAAYHGQVTLTRDSVNYVAASPGVIVKRPDSLLVLSFSQLQKIAVGARLTRAFTFEMDVLRLIDTLHDFTATFPIRIVTKHLNNLIVAVNGQVSTTKLTNEMPIWRVRAAAYASTWWLQNPGKDFEGLTSALYQLAVS